MFEFLKKLFSGAGGLPEPGRLDVRELSRRLAVSEVQLRGVPISYRTFSIRKRTGGERVIAVPGDALKAMQKRILRRLLGRLRAHPCATGFERGHSIVSNAMPHVGQDVVIKLDIKDFFTSTTARRIEAYFRRIGWDADAAKLLTTLCTREGSLPQGGCTSPRLSNLVNWRLDARLFALAQQQGMAYSRYADDLTFSGVASGKREVNGVIHTARWIADEDGYKLHTDKKLRIARKHDRQVVTGLVVNQKVDLPRSTRRRLRAIEHHLKQGKPATLTPQQMAGWHALQSMIRAQADQQSGS